MAHFLLPLGGLTKVEVREIAAQHGFLNARKRDSQDICFVPNGDYGGFIEHFTGTTVPCGNYIDREGNVLGTHKGHIRYTLGQRKNLNIALGKRAYVVDKDVNANTVTLGDNDELFSDGLIATDLNLIACDRIDQPSAAPPRPGTPSWRPPARWNRPARTSCWYALTRRCVR